jgi:hypothetical protein
MKKNRCNIEYKSHKILGWQLKLSGNCTNELAGIDKLPEKRKGYFKRRLIYSSESSSI